MMKYYFVLMFAILFVGCKPHDQAFYKKTFQKYKSEYYDIRSRLRQLVQQKDSIYKYGFQITGKRLVEDAYINDSITFEFDDVHLTEKDKDELAGFMYDMGVERAYVYRDSAKYVFSGSHNDTLVIYSPAVRNSRGVYLDTNAYLFFDTYYAENK